MPASAVTVRTASNRLSQVIMLGARGHDTSARPHGRSVAATPPAKP